MCKLSLKTGETNGFTLISGEIVRQVGERFRHLTGPAIPKRRHRKRSGSKVLEERMEKEAAQVSDDAEALSAETFGERLPSKDIEGTQEKGFVTEKEEPSDIPAPSPETRVNMKDISTEVDVGGLKIEVNIPHHIVKQAQSSTHEHRMKIAGALAAQIMKKHEELISTPSVDHISLWSDIRDFIANKLK
jgi:hypothetical protein